MAPLYPALFSNPLHCPCPGHFAEARRGKTGRCQGQKVSLESWSIFRPPGVSSALLMKFQGAKPFFATMAQNSPTPRLNHLKVYGCHPDRRQGTNCLTTRNRGLHGFDLRFKSRLAAIGREYLAIKSSAVSSVCETFWMRWRRGKEPLFDYSIVDFSIHSMTQLVSRTNG